MYVNGFQFAEVTINPLAIWSVLQTTFKSKVYILLMMVFPIKVALILRIYETITQKRLRERAVFYMCKICILIFNKKRYTHFDPYRDAHLAQAHLADTIASVVV